MGLTFHTVPAVAAVAYAVAYGSDEPLAYACALGIIAISFVILRAGRRAPRMVAGPFDPRIPMKNSSSFIFGHITQMNGPDANAPNMLDGMRELCVKHANPANNFS